MPPKPLSKANRIWPTRKVATGSSIKDVIEVSAVDLCIEENGKAFHTDRYELMGNPRQSGKPTQLVVRRGAPFVVKLLCNRAYDPTVDTVVLILSVDPFGSERINFGNGTEVNILLAMPGGGEPEAPQADDWAATLTENGKEADGKVALTVTITTPPRASVSKYNLEFHCRLDTTDTRSSFKIPFPLYLLFNPWCEADDVYLKDEAARQEYVLNDSTMIWKQMASSQGMTSWNLGQFEADILDCALWVIAVTGRLTPTYRGNPVRVVRALSGALNTNNGPGVLEGRWNGDYSGGVSPQAWSGSVKILRQFFFGGLQAVKYGQCWVFGGIFATVCRAVGIPNRIVTNFSSAHDTESSLTIDIFVDASGAAADDMSADSIWNYHVWNEVWMVRPDLGAPQYDGWQAVDATPQELSDGMFKLGPTPVHAVKHGEVNVMYDTEFLYAEVNADKIFWSTRPDDGLPKLMQINTSDVGKDVSTKAIGANEREDITSAYKYRENSKEERDVMAAAIKLGSQRFSSSGVAKKLLAPEGRVAKSSDTADQIKLELSGRGTHVLGQPFGVELIVSSTLESGHVQVSGTLVLKHTDYTGKHSEEIRKVPIDMKIGPLKSSSVTVEVQFSEYHNVGFDQSHIKVLCVVDVADSERTLFAQETFHLEMPQISMKLVDERMRSNGFSVQGTLKNPLPIPLTGGRFIIEGSRHTEPAEQAYDYIGVGSSVSFDYPLNMAHKGKSVVSARFISKELRNIHGHVEFDLGEAVRQ